MFKTKFLALIAKLRFISRIKLIFIVYLSIILVASFFLYLPITQVKGIEPISYLNSLFTSVSAFSDTGLSTIILADSFNFLGQAVVAILILIGGFGFFAIKIYIFNFVLSRRINVSSNSLITAERAGLNFGTAKEIVFVSLTVLLITLLSSSVLLSFFFYYLEGDFQGYKDGSNPYHNFWTSLRYGLFHAISAINNAGFDIIGANSISPYYHVYPINITLMLLFILGGIGYPVIFDLYTKIKNKLLKKGHHNLSLLSKLSLTSYFFTSLVGFILIFFIEFFLKNSFFLKENYGSDFKKGFILFFLSLSTRSAGLTPIDINELNDSSKFVLLILMFIGAAPFSTAGGLRTTTFAIIFMVVFSKISGSETINIFKRRIATKTIHQSLAVFCFALFLVITISLFIGIIFEYIYDKPISFIDIIFEVTSAFGTTGLTTGVTTKGNTITKILTIFLMFIGQLGLSSTLFIIKNKRPSQSILNVADELPIP